MCGISLLVELLAAEGLDTMESVYQSVGQPVGWSGSRLSQPVSELNGTV